MQISTILILLARLLQSRCDTEHRHAVSRWHVMDPIRFEQDLRVTLQALGWRSEGRNVPGQHNMRAVAYGYQTLPTAPFPPLPNRDLLEIN